MKTDHPWSSDAMFSKAQAYADNMEEFEAEASKFGLFSAVMLEFLVRAAVAKKSPVLLADISDWNNILYGLTIESKKKKFVPRSASVTELVSRLEELTPEFTREHANFCSSHFARRNTEVHSGELAFENLRASTWLPNLYSVCDVLAKAAGQSLETLFSGDVAKRAIDDIEALRDETAKEVLKTVAAYKTVWERMTNEEQEVAKARADAASLRHLGHRVRCPACECVALVQGIAVGPAKQLIDEDGVVERQTIKPENFACAACGLKISGYSKLLAVALGDAFTSTSHYDAVDFFQPDLDSHVQRMVDERMRGMFEDDNNEY